jgi:hypothetical protein
MHCDHTQQAMIEMLYNDLPVATRHALEAHRATCATCAEMWVSLLAMQQALDQWQDVSPPAAVRARVLAQVAAQRRAVRAGVWWRRELVHTGLAVGAGLALMTVTVFLLSRFLPLEAVTPPALLLCGSLWAGAYIGLCRLALSETAGTPWWWGRGGLPLTRAAGMALLAVGVATLLLTLSLALPVVAVLERFVPTPWLPFLSGGTVALLALGVSSWGLGRVTDARPLLPVLLAACFFVLAVAPGLLMFCVPFTVGVYSGVLLAVGLGASAGGALGALLRPRTLRSAQD